MSPSLAFGDGVGEALGDRLGDRLIVSSGDGGISERGLNFTDVGLRGGRVRFRKEDVWVLDRLKGILGVVITSLTGATFLMIGDAALLTYEGRRAK